MRKRLVAASALLLAGLVSVRANAALSLVSGVNPTETFTTTPDPTRYTTGSIAGTAADAATAGDLLSAVQTVTAASMNTAFDASTTVASTGTAGHATFFYHSVEQRVFSVPTGVKASLFMATLSNGAADPLTALTVDYLAGSRRLTGSSSSTVEELPGHRVYYSTTGLANSWAEASPAPTYPNGDAAAATQAAQVSITGLNVAPGGSLYVLWADDNAVASPATSGSSEGVYAVDDLKFTATTTAQAPEPGTVGVIAVAGIGFVARRRRAR